MTQFDHTTPTFSNALHSIIEALDASALIEAVEVLDTHGDCAHLRVDVAGEPGAPLVVTVS